MLAHDYATRVRVFCLSCLDTAVRCSRREKKREMGRSQLSYLKTLCGLAVSSRVLIIVPVRRRLRDVRGDLWHSDAHTLCLGACLVVLLRHLLNHFRDFRNDPWHCDFRGDLWHCGVQFSSSTCGSPIIFFLAARFFILFERICGTVMFTACSWRMVWALSTIFPAPPGRPRTSTSVPTTCTFATGSVYVWAERSPA